MPRLNGKNILVTGASQGLGRQLALTFAREGATGLSLIARHLAPLQKVRDEVGEISKRTNVLAVEADVGKISDIERLVATTLDAFGGRLDVVVNNASTIGPAPMPFLLDYPLEDFQNVMNTNLIGPFLIIKNQRDERCWRYGLPGLGRVRDLKVRARRSLSNLGRGIGRNGCPRQLG